MGFPQLQHEAQPCEASSVGALAVLDALTAQMVVLDRRGTITMANRAWQQFADENGGADPAKIGVGANYLDVCRIAEGADAAEAQAVFNGIRAVLAGEVAAFALEYPCHSPSELRWFLLQATPLPATAGGAVVTHINITSRVLAERALIQAKAELEHAVMERTRDLHDVTDQLRFDIAQRREAEATLTRYAVLLQQQTERLERSNSDLQQFAHVVSHELHEPLRMVASFLTLLRQRYADRLDATAQEFIEYAVDGATRMQRLISSLLTYAQIDQHGERLGPVSCEEALANALAGLRVNIEETGAVVNHGRLPTVHGSGVLLSQLFQNLISNAIKFRSAAPPQILVTAERSGGHWTFGVRDNGIGVAPQDAERIFRMFERGQRRATHAGSGIGLAVCQRIVTMHGGTLWVESVPGNGATFRFTLPAEPAQQ
jgi:signal transduction histidine kinase